MNFLYNGFVEIFSSIECPLKGKINRVSFKKAESICEALSLIRSLNRLETVLLRKLLNAFLTGTLLTMLIKVTIVSKVLQEPGIEICTVLKHLN